MIKEKATINDFNQRKDKTTKCLCIYIVSIKLTQKYFLVKLTGFKNISFDTLHNICLK